MFNTCSIDIPGMFEAKGVAGAAERLTLLAGDVREPFPTAAKEAKVCWVPLALMYLYTTGVRFNVCTDAVLNTVSLPLNVSACVVCCMCCYGTAQHALLPWSLLPVAKAFPTSHL